MRGKAEIEDIAVFSYGITPAYAGKSPKTAPTCPASRDHPRLCGEKILRLEKKMISEGSPPPMRGKANCPRICVENPGITPAYAGKRPTTQGLHFFHRDHPRLCGEKETALLESHSQRGSPPPMRGKAKWDEWS